MDEKELLMLKVLASETLLAEANILLAEVVEENLGPLSLWDGAVVWRTKYAKWLK